MVVVTENAIQPLLLPQLRTEMSESSRDRQSTDERLLAFSPKISIRRRFLEGIRIGRMKGSRRTHGSLRECDSL
eukprot:438756-Prymnesium_polylepis.1